MNKFINNRIGTYLKESEISNIRRNAVRDFKKGDILVKEDSHDTYRFVLYISVDKGIAQIITKDTSDNIDYIQQSVDVNSLIGYVKTEPISQNYKPNEEILTEEGLLETYIIN